ncbi:hypothetical protein GCM10009720_15660 [Yaniella flava]|uniref:Integrase catalytic domain-containing protein n=1 Tax=Yaniella flava TaxID=287930 RepID=A0ABP5G210_9MICC|nr:DDE-type integrase/transposase/recombinase [Micrococcaceae bacterium]
MTGIQAGQGWLYLATVIDLCTGMVIGWNTANHMRTDLCIGALQMARDQGYFHSDQVVYHTDRGAQGGFNWSWIPLRRWTLLNSA